jgi:phosphoketolase
MGRLVGTVGERDRNYLVANADGNEASGIANINQR